MLEKVSHTADVGTSQIRNVLQVSASVKLHISLVGCASKEGTKDTKSASPYPPQGSDDKWWPEGGDTAPIHNDPTTSGGPSGDTASGTIKHKV
jgi:hypothetical protein